MIRIQPDFYRAVARLLAARIAPANFFNGRVEYDTEELASALTATLIVYRDGERVADVVPVWWEFSLMQPGGEAMTDFAWSELKEYLMEYF